MQGALNLFFDALVGIFLGVSLAAPPGPVTSVIVRRSVNSPLSGIFVGFGAMTADFILLLVVLFTNAYLSLASYETYIYAAGSLMIFYFAANLIRKYGKEEEFNRSGSYLAGLAIGIVNPFEIIWWLSSGIAFLLQFGIQVFYFLFAGTTIWVVMLSYSINRVSKAYGEKMIRAASLFSIAVLIFFGVLFLYLFAVRIL